MTEQKTQNAGDRKVTGIVPAYWKLFCLAALALMASVVALPSLLAAQPGIQKSVTVEGEVSVVESDIADFNATVEINGVAGKIGKDGRYSVRLADADIYQMRFQGDDIFEAVQTFAHVELERGDQAALTVPDIHLVEKAEGRVELVFGGDMMMGRRYLKPQFGEHTLIHPESRAADMEKLVQGMKPYFTPADFSAVNLEAILAESDPGEHAPKSVVFYTHPQALGALKTMGVDYVSLGNNHTFDYLDKGLKSTFDALKPSGIGYSGAGFNEREALAAYRTQIKGQDYSMLGYVGWAGRVTPNQVAEAGKGGAALGTEENIRASVGREAADDRVTVVQYHGNSEYSEAPSARHEKRLRAAIDAGADLVVGHHPHVSHGLELYNGKLIAWSLGNFMFDQFFIATHPAYVLKVWMDGETFYRAEIVPIHVKDYRPLPAVAGVRRHILQRVVTQSAKRDTILTMSGGHAVLQGSGQGWARSKRTFFVGDNDKGVKALDYDHNPHNGYVGFSTFDGNVPDAIFGRDLLLRGDFESYGLMGVKERTWAAQNGSFDEVRTPRGGRFALKYQPTDVSKPATFGLKTFTRVLLQDDYSFSGWIKPEGRVKVSATVQYRPSGMNRYKALAEAPHEPIGSMEMRGGTWQEFQFDLKVRKAKNGRALPMRVTLTFENLADGTNTNNMLFDDFALIGWEAPDSAKPVDVPNRRTHLLVR